MYVKHAIGDIVTEISPVKDETTSYEDEEEDMKIDVGKKYPRNTYTQHLKYTSVIILHKIKIVQVF